LPKAIREKPTLLVFATDFVKREVESAPEDLPTGKSTLSGLLPYDADFEGTAGTTFTRQALNIGGSSRHLSFSSIQPTRLAARTLLQNASPDARED
jgi:hypothetical protein